MVQHLRAGAVLVVGILLLALPFDARVRGVVGPALKPFRIAQTWSLYSTGPRELRRFEVWVDGQLTYRAGDRAHRWRRHTLTYRRVRPTIVHSCIGDGRNRAHLVAWLLRELRDDHPEAKEVVVRCTVTPFPGGGAETVEMAAIAHAPDWVPELTP